MKCCYHTGKKNQIFKKKFSIKRKNFQSCFTESNLKVLEGDALPSINYFGIFSNFKAAIWPTEVKFAGNMRRKDLDVALVARNNSFFSENVGIHFISPKMDKGVDFSDNHLSSFPF